MELHFFKYQGCGNDFILIDNRQAAISLSKEQIASLCHRRFGIGADGLMLLENAPGFDFRMVYFNSDGGESTMCGNGGRCIVAFAHHLGIVQSEANFIAVDGVHTAKILEQNKVCLGMQDVAAIKLYEDHALLDTGSPHFVQWVDSLVDFPVVEQGRSIRYDQAFAPGGTNVNFAKVVAEDTLEVRTYERGVEDETMSCGTGVTAVAIASSGAALGQFSKTIHTPGGILSVDFFKKQKDAAILVQLTGAARFVFDGKLDLASLVLG